MRIDTLLLRNLHHHARHNLAVLLAAAVGCTVLTGALLVGDSVRGSLRDNALSRLGSITHVLRAPHFFRSALAAELSPPTDQPHDVVPAIVLAGGATHAESRARTGRITVFGVTPAFWIAPGESDAPAPPPDARSVVLNEELARRLGAAVGDDVLLRLPRASDVALDSLMGRRDDATRTLRLKVSAVIADAGVGALALSPQAEQPANAYVDLGALQAALEQPDRANTLLARESPAQPAANRDLAARLRSAARPEDLGLAIKPRPAHGYVSLESHTLQLDPLVETAALRAAQACDAAAVPVLAYLANELIALPSGAPPDPPPTGVPYSTVAAVAAGGLPIAIPPGAIVLNDWTAAQLRVAAGDPVELTYYLSTDAGRIDTRRARFRVQDVLPLAGALADPGWTPEYPGITDTRRISDWDPPFPVDLRRIRPIDEDYWDAHRTTPKAFLSLEDARTLWAEPGDERARLTSIRLTPRAGESLDEFVVRYTRALAGELGWTALGLRFEAVRENALRASQGATDFSGLFIGFSFFLIASAALLISLAFRLNVERRAPELGTLLALGFSRGEATRLFLAEGLAVAAVGCELGLLGAAGYAWLMLTGLRTAWSQAANAPFLELHVSITSFAIGFAASWLVAILAITLALRGLLRMSPRALLSGSTAVPLTRKPAARGRGLATAGFALVAVAAAAWGARSEAPIAAAGAFFAAGAAALVASILVARILLSAGRRSAIVPGRSALARLGWSNAQRRPGRSLSTIALLACATFLIVALGAFRLDPGDTHDRDGGAGGFTVLAEATTPLPYPLTDTTGREQLALSSAAAELLARSDVHAMRLRPGDNTSCRSLYRAGQMRILGMPDSLIQRGGFRFAAAMRPTPPNPWELLRTPLPDGAIPVIGDEAAVRWQLKSGLGRDLAISDERGNPVTLRFVALLSGSPLQDELLIGDADFRALFPSIAGQSFFLLAPPRDQEDALRLSLERELEPYALDAALTADRLRAYLAVQNTYLSTFQTLGAFGLALGALGLAAVTLRNVWERRREIALLRALGFPPSAVQTVILAETLALIALGLLAGLMPAALAAAPAAIARPAALPFAALLTALGGLAAAGVLTAWLAARATRRDAVVHTLRAE